MNRQELIDFIITKIENYGIDYRAKDFQNQKAYISPSLKIGAYILDASPFDHAHEFIHAIHGDNLRQCECDTVSPAEKRANCESILMLWDIYEINGGGYKEFAHFIELTGCPYDLAHNLISKKRAVITDRRDIYKTLKRYVLETDEEPEDWNVYRIMEECCIDIAENYYAMQVLLEISHELLGVF